MEMKVYLSKIHWAKMAIRIVRYRKLQSFDQTGNEKNFEPEVKKIIFRKLVKNCLESPILVFWYLVTGRRQRSLKSYQWKWRHHRKWSESKNFSWIFGFSGLMNSILKLVLQGLLAFASLGKCPHPNLVPIMTKWHPYLVPPYDRDDFPEIS